MSRVLYLYERMMPTVTLNQNAAQAIFEGTDVEYQFMPITEVSSKVLDKTDVLILIRPQNNLFVDIAKKSRKVGKFVIVSLDDDLLNLPQAIPSIPWRGSSLIGTLKSADMVLSSSSYICEKYRNYTRKKRSAYSNTPVTAKDLQMIPEQDTDYHTVRLVYAAGANHEGLFDQYIRPGIKKLNEKYADRISLTFVGVNPDLSQMGLKMQINYQKGMPLEEYREYMREQHFDIGLSPLHDDSFSKCKYFNKYIEYTLIGAVGIYSNCEPYTFVIKDGINGFLADNTTESWIETICRAVEDTNLRRSCIEKAQKHLREEFNIDTIRNKLLTDIPELIRMPVSNDSCGELFTAQIKYRLFRVADVIYLTFFYLRREGLTGVFERIRMHIADDELQMRLRKKKRTKEM